MKKNYDIKRLFLGILFISLLASCSSSKIAKEYKNLNYTQLTLEKKQLLNELSYFKVESYLNKVREGESRYSLASISDKKIKSIFEYAPDDLVYRREWKSAVKEFTNFQDKYSPELKKHRDQNYKVRFNSKEERDLYYKEYTILNDDLKYEKLDEYNYFHNNFDDKLNKMWLNRGFHLLNYYKSKNIEIPTDWLKYKDLEDIENQYKYIDLTKRIKYLDKKTSKMKK